MTKVVEVKMLPSCQYAYIQWPDFLSAKCAAITVVLQNFVYRMAGITKPLEQLSLAYTKRLLRASDPAMVVGIGDMYHRVTVIFPFDNI
jgi:hypothetical protein